ncbi:hypothetical protein HanXRQr2_Chr12g0547031 [Helianthus annuus]|uniref:Uncharacterized protein n=1 Tax=Helianthus annuus TaxID=4232 RepID=A0A9K3MWE4_HELAN|nr:hypothetical protein HanXRQr2_Chr12g0547031 [Helianthus annuus]
MMTKHNIITIHHATSRFLVDPKISFQCFFRQLNNLFLAKSTNRTCRIILVNFGCHMF